MPVKAIHSILKVNLGVTRNERVLVFTDKPTSREDITPADRKRRERLRDIAHLVEETARGLCQSVDYIEYPALGGHGKEPPESLWRMAFGDGAIDTLKEDGLLNPIRRKKASPAVVEETRRVINRYKSSGVDAVVALSNYSTSHTMFRNFLTNVCGTRYASMPLFDIAMFDGPMKADYKKMAKRTREVATVLKKSVSVRITTPAGTDISFDTKGRKAEADTGILTKTGAFGNLPAY